MKKILIIQLICLIQISFTQNSSAQSGIYTSWEDYQKARPSYNTNCDSPDKKNKLHISGNHIDIIQATNKLHLSKDSIFGYRDCHMRDFRFSSGKEYQIRENNKIAIYTIDKREYSTTGKTFVLKPAYYFSNGINRKILPLTTVNLKKAFPDNIKFHDLLDVEFSEGTPIESFDKEQRMFKVNLLLNKSIN